MVLIAWNESYSVGIGQIDEQHKRLFTLINDLHEAMKRGEGRQMTGEILKGLAEYTVYHFKTEEEYFLKFAYPETVRHKQAHRAFVDKVATFRADFAAGEATLTMQIMEFLKGWLIQHIKGEDRRYTQCFRDHGLE